MNGVAACFWNEIAPKAGHPEWRRIFSLDGDAQHQEIDRIYAQMKDAGVDDVVASAYLAMAPLLHERVAIQAFVASRSDLRHALPEVLSANEAILYAVKDFHLTVEQTRELRTLLLKPPSEVMVMSPTMVPASLDEWIDEVFAIELEGADFNVAMAAIVPGQSYSLEELLGEDEDFDEAFEHWHQKLYMAPELMLAIEHTSQDGVPLPTGERAARLSSLPADCLLELGVFWNSSRKDLVAVMTNFVFHLVRSERMRRTGQVEWPVRRQIR